MTTSLVQIANNTGIVYTIFDGENHGKDLAIPPGVINYGAYIPWVGRQDEMWKAMIIQEQGETLYYLFQDYYGDRICISENGQFSSRKKISGDSTVNINKLLTIKANGELLMQNYGGSLEESIPLPDSLKLKPLKSILDQKDPMLVSLRQKILVDFNMQIQSQPYWCWAAVTVSICTFFDPLSSWTQCKLANKYFNGNCCTNPNSQTCNRSYEIGKPLQEVGHLKSMESKASSFSTIINEINDSRPIVCGVVWPAWNVGHLVCIFGFTQADYGSLVEQWVFVKDPAFPGFRKLLIDVFKNHYDGHSTWIETFLTKN